MKLVLKFVFLFAIQLVYGQVELNADGPGNTYDLITSVLAPGQNPIETPDCNHNAFGDHIDEIFDAELNTNVFRFFIHTTPDNDRCINFDRQRNEIKTYNQSPDNLLGVQNEKVVYKWKFKLADGFQSSPNFTHLHQLKSVGGSLESMPMYTLTTRKGTPDQLELRYAETDNQITLAQTDLAPLIDSWLEVTETIEYGTFGTYEIEIVKVSDNSSMFSYSNNSIINWRPGADFVRPKWGIYRSLINDQDLRDEAVLFANFSIQELVPSDIPFINDTQVIFTNPIANIIYIKDSSKKANSLKLFDMSGRLVMNKTLDSGIEFTLDVSNFPKGIYILNFSGDQYKQSEVIVVN